MSAKALPLLSAVLVIGLAGLVSVEHTQAQARTDVQIDRAALEGVTLTISSRKFSNDTIDGSTSAVLCHSTLTRIVSDAGARS